MLPLCYPDANSYDCTVALRHRSNHYFMIAKLSDEKNLNAAKQQHLFYCLIGCNDISNDQSERKLEATGPLPPTALLKRKHIWESFSHPTPLTLQTTCSCNLQI